MVQVPVVASRIETDADSSQTANLLKWSLVKLHPHITLKLWVRSLNSLTSETLFCLQSLITFRNHNKNSKRWVSYCTLIFICEHLIRWIEKEKTREPSVSLHFSLLWRNHIKPEMKYQSSFWILTTWESELDGFIIFAIYQNAIPILCWQSKSLL